MSAGVKLKKFTDRWDGACFVDVRAVVAIVDARSPSQIGLTNIVLFDLIVITVKGWPSEVHDWLYNDIPMGERTPAEASSPT